MSAIEMTMLAFGFVAMLYLVVLMVVVAIASMAEPITRSRVPEPEEYEYSRLADGGPADE